MIELRVHLPIGLGDLIRAIRALNASDQEAATVAQMLGLRAPRIAQRATLEQPSVKSAPIGSSIGGVESATDGAVIEPAAPLTTPPVVPEPAIADGEIELTFVGTDTPPARSWISNAAELADPAADAALQYEATVPPFEPLLAPVITRAVLTSAAATPAGDGPIDIDRLIHDVALRRPIRELPRLSTITLRRGAQILVDRSESMQPFQFDADDLAARLQRVASQGSTQLLYFDEDPTIVNETWPVGEGRLHDLPPAGTPLILITDLGIRDLRSNRARTRPYWWEFATKALRRRCPVIAFVPYPLSRWPVGLNGLITPLPWDRKTTVATIRAARRNADR